MQQLVFEALRLRGQRLRLASNAHKAGQATAALSTAADAQQQPTSLPQGLLVSTSLMLGLHCTNKKIRIIAVRHQHVQHALSYDLEGNCVCLAACSAIAACCSDIHVQKPSMSL